MKLVHLTIIAAFASFTQSSKAGLIGDIAKDVAVEVLVDLTKAGLGKIYEGMQGQSATEDDKKRLSRIITTLIDESIPISERVGLYATTAHYFSAGELDQRGILQAEAQAQQAWPYRRYELISIDEVEVAPDRSNAAVTYTVRFEVARGTVKRQGTSRVALLLGSYDSQPRIYVIKAWTKPQANEIAPGVYIEVYYGSKSGGPQNHDLLKADLAGDPNLKGVSLHCIEGEDRSADGSVPGFVVNAERRLPPTLAKQCKGSGAILVGPVQRDRASELMQLLASSYLHLYPSVRVVGR